MQQTLSKLVNMLRHENSDELVELMRGGFAKNEPISCIHHCLSVALISARLAKHLGYSDYDAALAYAAGLAHDYEKLGPAFARLSDEEKVELLTSHLDNLEVGDEGIAKRALRIARGLEEGFIPLPDRKVAGLVKLADYVMGLRYEASDPVAVAGYITAMSRELLGKRIEAHPILLGSQRPIALYVAERIAEEIEECGGEPLIATPMGLVYLPGNECELSDELLRELAKHIIEEFSEQPTKKTEGKRAPRRSPVEDAEMRGIRLCEAVNANKNPGSAVSMKRPPSPHEVEEIINKLLEDSIPEGRRPYVLAGLLVFAAKLLNPENPKKSIPALASLFGASARSWKDLPKVLGLCEGRVPQGLRESLQELTKMLQEAAEKLRGGDVVDYLAKRLGEVVHVPTVRVMESRGRTQGAVRHCSLCRAPVPERLAQQFTLKKYRDTLAHAGVSLAQEVFHPDVQGAPADTRIAEEVKKLPICPLCFYEARYMAGYSITPGNWSIVIHYGPSVAYDVLQVARKVVTQVGEAPVFVDPLSARLVAPHDSPYLRKQVLRWAFRSWYLVGGSLALTRNPFTLPTPSSRMIYIDKADAIIEAIDALMLNALRKASRSKDYWRVGTSALRRSAYQLLQLYVESLEEAKAQGKVRLRPVLRVPLVSPSLTVLALYTSSKLR